MVFTKKAIHDNVIFDSYLQHLASGLPSSSWSSKLGSVPVTALSISSFLGDLFDIKLVDLAKAKGVAIRYKMMMDLTEDPKTAIAKLAVLKAVHETFFTDQINEKLDQGLLMQRVNEIISETKEAEEAEDENDQ